MVLAVIPARYASTRLPGKPLIDLGGKTLVQRVYEGASSCALVDKVLVATDDLRIQEHVLAFGGEVVMTDNDHPSGTDRVAQAARAYPEAEIVVNVQGDEPFITAQQVASVVGPFVNADVAITTLACRIREEQALLSPNVVKVVADDRKRALYFSRHAIPYLRDVPIGRWIDAGKHLQHIGLYAYRASVLQELTRLPQAELEVEESLEQLRWLSAGYRIHVGTVDKPGFGVDTQSDVEEARRMIGGRLAGWPPNHQRGK